MPAQGIHVRDQTARTIDRNSHKIAGLAKRPVGVDLPADQRVLPPFHLRGPIFVSESDPLYAHRALRIIIVHAALGTAGTSSTVVELRRNGTAVATVTLASGVLSATADVYSALTADLDYLTVAVTTAGAGAAGLVVQARYQT